MSRTRVVDHASLTYSKKHAITHTEHELYTEGFKIIMMMIEEILIWVKKMKDEV